MASAADIQFDIRTAAAAWFVPPLPRHIHPPTHPSLPAWCHYTLTCPFKLLGETQQAASLPLPDEPVCRLHAHIA